MLDGHKFKGYLPGGASGGILPARLGNIPLDFDTLQEYDCFIGSAVVILFRQGRYEGNRFKFDEFLKMKVVDNVHLVGMVHLWLLS